MLTYRSKGVHTNRKGGKMARKARNRNGTPSRPKPKQAAKPSRMAQAAKVGAVAMSDMGAQMQAAQERFSAEHDQAAAEGTAMLRSALQGTPGKAAGIIKNRRV